MERTLRVNDDELDWALTLRAEDRLRQANAAFRLFHALHRPFERPFHRGFDSLDDFLHSQEGGRLPR